MTEEERISRDALLKRAAALAGSVYVAPTLTSSAAAAASACSGDCKAGKKGKKTCKKRGGPDCECVDEAGARFLCDCDVKVRDIPPRKTCGGKGEPCDPNPPNNTKVCVGDGKCTDDCQINGAACKATYTYLCNADKKWKLDDFEHDCQLKPPKKCKPAPTTCECLDVGQCNHLCPNPGGTCNPANGNLDCIVQPRRCPGCEHIGSQCSPLEPCQTGNCGCFLDGHGQNPAGCIDLMDGLCQTFADQVGVCPGGNDEECPAGACCFSSCCEDSGFPHLCARPCLGGPVPANRSKGGRGSLYTRA